MDLKKQQIFLIFIILLSPLSVFSQVGLSVSPPRLFYSLNPGETGSQKIIVNNISKSVSLNLSFSLSDWKYNEYGVNTLFPLDSLPNSCSNWIKINEQTYITLGPGEIKEIEISMSVPQQIKDNVHTAMLYVTQMNPVDGVNEEGVAIKINVRSGIKIYYKSNAPEVKKLEIKKLSFDKEKKALKLIFNNKGNIWINGTAKTTLLNQSSGKEIILENTDFYTLPDDHRIMYIPINNKTAKGRYTATVMLDYGDDNNIEAAELEFDYE